MFIILLSLLFCLVAFWAYTKISSQINVLVPKLPKALNFLEFGLFKLNFHDLCKKINYVGEYTNKNGGVTRFNYGPIPMYIMIPGELLKYGGEELYDTMWKLFTQMFCDKQVPSEFKISRICALYKNKVVSDAEDMVTVLNKCTKKIFVYDLIKPYVGSQLINADFPVWKRNRRLLDLAFKLNILNGYMNIFNAQASRLAITMAKYVNKETDFSSLIGRSHMETSCRSKMKPFIDLLLELARDTNCFTDQEIREHIDNMIIAGHDTSATVLVYCILLVGSYPKVQQKIHDELKNVFGDEDRDITKQDLTQLVYLEAVIKESMRFYPVVPVIGRHLHEDIKLRNCTLLKGNTVMLFICGVNQDSMWGPDVEEFRPERWLDPSTLPDHTYTSASFSIGRRSCIGKTYAMMSLKIIMAHFCRNYMVHGDHTKLTRKLDVMLKPFSGHHITIEKRN